MSNIGVLHDWYLMCSAREYQMSSGERAGIGAETASDFSQGGLRAFNIRRVLRPLSPVLTKRFSFHPDPFLSALFIVPLVPCSLIHFSSVHTSLVACICVTPKDR